MDISNIAEITVSIESPGVTKPGFGVPLVYGQSSVLPGSTPVVSVSLATWSVDMLALGFVASDPQYLAVKAIATQDPKPQRVKVCRATQVMADHDVDITVATAVEGEELTITIEGEDPANPGTLTSETYTRTVPAASNTTAEATALAALITAGIWGAASWVTATGAVAVVELRGQVAMAGKVLYYDEVANLLIDDVTAARTVATDLDAIVAYDPDFYALVPCDSGTLDAMACSAWAEAQTNKVCFLQSQDSDIWNAGTGIMHDLSALDSKETHGTMTKRSLRYMINAGVAGRFLPKDPGTTNWAMKNISGSPPSSLTGAESGRAHADFCNTYEGVTIGGIEVVQGTLYGGWTLGSAATFMDTIRLRDAMVVEVQTEILALQLAADKVPFSDRGIAQVQASILEAIRRFEGPNAGFVPGSAFCNVPTAASVSSIDKAARNLPSVSFGALANGAIIKVTATGSISI